MRTRLERATKAPETMSSMAVVPTGYHLYGDLAVWWPLISPPEEYADDAALAVTLFGSAAIPVDEVVELGSGGGHTAVHLTSDYTMTLVDLSEPMLEMSRRLNPECEHRQADMRIVRLGRTFDGVFVHDAVDYMTTETDLAQVMTTAYAHCRAGGVAVFVPDVIAETYAPSSGSGGSDGDDGRAAYFQERSWDPDPNDTWTITEYTFLLRDAGGSERVVRETHRMGVFPRAVWLRLLTDTGFEPEVVPESAPGDRTPRQLFVAHRPLP